LASASSAPIRSVASRKNRSIKIPRKSLPTLPNPTI
jgi:hypothetical protein